ncbi:uncharacterized protein LOC126778531 [Nymphalis io]|uniref:uncharacterized protein LOC126778531 n=1 Tax=Inachis io TaxID=171585 RepID=UPI00216AAF76|nr:uncharacterized protein LOC126778531 [Nymphalis io]
MLVFNFLIVTIAIYCEIKSVTLDNLKLDENNAPTSNINFVEAIKKDLKRNNDDYKEMIQKSAIPNNKKAKVITDNETKNRASANMDKKGYRRKNGGSYQEYEYEDTIKLFSKSSFIFKSNNKSITPYTVRFPQKINRNHSRFDKRHNLILSIPNRTPNTYQAIKNFSPTSSIRKLNFQPPSEIPKFINKNKIDKFKRFMKKNQGLLKNFVSSNQAALRQTPFKEVSMHMDNLELLKPKLSRKGIKNIQRHGGKNDGELPSPELLDMAPAIGGRIHKRRVKGQLCHRHVLLPEGPKYDSRGRWYLPAHELIAKHPFNATHQPVMLLPRCCNCCKKSVLGCE